MADITQLLDACQQGDPQAASRLLPLVYDELRRLAAQRMSHELPGQTLCATALVHEAYLRLVGSEDDQAWDNRGHFFAAAATAMRRILVDRARQRNSLKRGGDLKRQEVDDLGMVATENPEELIALDEALTKMAESDERLAKLVDLRYFAGLKLSEVAKTMGISPRTADRWWAYARAWLFNEINS